MTVNKQNFYKSSSLPKEPIDVILNPLSRFLHVESASGIVLFLATAIALALANSPLGDSFLSFWKIKIGFVFGNFEMKHSLQHWINDLLMAIFFFVIGLEVKRELVIGELRDMKRAALPIAAALGGMIAPAAIYLTMQIGSPGERGWGIPMATDIAFVVGCMAILGSRIPNSFRVLILSLAIADDIGAILVIAIGYTAHLDLYALLWGVFGILAFIVLMKIGVRNTFVFVVTALFVWYQIHASGIHATIAGVIIGVLTPLESWVSENRLNRIVQNTMKFLQGEGWQSSGERYQMLRQMERATRKSISPLQRFETDLHPWVSFLIMPIFALANAGVPIQTDYFTDPIAIAIICGLLIGKPLGIFLFSFLSVKIGFAKLPEEIDWGVLIGGGFLAGIGFTMALFIAGLALDGTLLDAAKVGILVGSVLSAIVGVVLLRTLLPEKQTTESSGH
jgi:NhaA family Na+:H+ antiporter